MFVLVQFYGVIVNVNFMVIWYLQLKYGIYKMVKFVLLVMLYLLVMELGEQGICVNFVVFGYIWGDMLKSYFDYQVGKYGIIVDQIYQVIVVNFDFKWLLIEDEVVLVIFFLVSDLVSGIIGQILDVNCGEYYM